MIEIKKNVKSGFEHHDEIMKKIKKIAGKIPFELISEHGDLKSVKVDDSDLSSTKKTALKNYIESL